MFYKSSPQILDTSADNLSDCYITNRVAAGNRFYIDDNSVLWGYGGNTYGQLGNGQVSDLAITDQAPAQIASNVISVDCSDNGYFCIYLTENGDLYTWGLNIFGECGVPVAADDYLRHPQSETSHIYADTFIPVQIKRYSPEEMRKTVGQIDIGTDVEEVKQFLSDRGIHYSFFLDIDDNGKLSELDL